MFSSIKKCLLLNSGDSTYKKIDQCADGAIQVWIEKHPLELKLHSFSPERIDKLIKNVLNNLPKGQIGWDNLELVKDHLNQFADQTQCTKYSLLQQISSLQMEKPFKEELKKAISTRTPRY